MVVPPAVPEVAAAAFVHVPGSVLLSMYGVESTNLLGRVNVKLAVPLSPATDVMMNWSDVRAHESAIGSTPAVQVVVVVRPDVLKTGVTVGVASACGTPSAAT